MKRNRVAAAWQASFGTLQERAAIAADPAASAEELAAVAPSYRDPDGDVDLIRTVLAHPNCPAGVVGRYATHADPQIRLLTAAHDRVPRTSLDVLAADRDETVRAAARRRIASWPPGPT